MVIPERSSRVKKWIINTKTIRWAISLAAFVLFLTLVTSIVSLRYLAHKGDFEEALLKNQYLEGQVQSLQNKLSTSDATLVRIQNFEQKLRSLARLDTPASSEAGIGPISKEDQALMNQERLGREVGRLSSANQVPSEYVYRMRSLELSIEDLHSRASLQEQSLQEVYELLKDQESLLSATPSVWPAKGWVTSRFGYRISPFTGLKQLHDGLDIAAPLGTKVNAPADGVVTHVSTDSGYGKVLVINHGYGVVTRYGHNSEIMVKVGQRVSRGDLVSLVGNTGRSTGSHLHYEVRVNGIPVNPSRYILN